MGKVRRGLQLEQRIEIEAPKGAPLGFGNMSERDRWVGVKYFYPGDHSALLGGIIMTILQGPNQVGLKVLIALLQAPGSHD